MPMHGPEDEDEVIVEGSESMGDGADADVKVQKRL